MTRFAVVPSSGDLSALVRDALASVPDDLLAGLGSIILRDKASLARWERRQRFKIASGRSTRARARGLYYQKDKTSSARIELYIDNILEEHSTLAMRIPVLRNFAVTEVLYHEIGHHIQATADPRKISPERYADKWAESLTRRFMRTRYRRWLWLPELLLRPFKHMRRLPPS